VAVFGEIGAFVLGHAGQEVFDEVVGDEGVAEVEFGYVGLVGGGVSWDLVLGVDGCGEEGKG